MIYRKSTKLFYVSKISKIDFGMLYPVPGKPPEIQPNFRGDATNYLFEKRIKNLIIQQSPIGLDSNTSFLIKSFLYT